MFICVVGFAAYKHLFCSFLTVIFVLFVCADIIRGALQRGVLRHQESLRVRQELAVTATTAAVDAAAAAAIVVPPPAEQAADA